MWFRSAKEFKENMKDKIILIITTKFTIYSFKEIEQAVNHNEREMFVDLWLSEPAPDKRFKFVPIVYEVDPNTFN